MNTNDLSPTLAIDTLSPILISGGPGILTLRDEIAVPDGGFYKAIYSERWQVHVAGLQLNNSASRNQREHMKSPPQGIDLMNFSIVAFDDQSQPMLSVMSNNYGGFAYTPEVPNFGNNRNLYILNHVRTRTTQQHETQGRSDQRETVGAGGSHDSTHR